MEVKNKPKKLNLKNLDYGVSESEAIFYFLFPEKKTANYFACDFNTNVIDCLREGIPKRAVDSILEKTTVSRTQLSYILHISNRQLNRYEKDDRLSPEQSNFLYEFTRIYTRGLDILGDSPTLDKWLMRPNMALGEKSPMELLDTSEGVRIVNNLLYNIEYGFYS
jgi:putative toxin-antitoxin system antitoxin component (TIGR02293 family)